MMRNIKIDVTTFCQNGCKDGDTVNNIQNIFSSNVNFENCMILQKPRFDEQSTKDTSHDPVPKFLGTT